MATRVLWLLTLGAAVGSGLVGGVFFAFSSFVMPALARLPPAQGVAAMQAINVAAICRSFMGLLFGVAAACLALGIHGLWDRGAPGAGLTMLASAIYLLGTIGVTMAFNVPRNDALAALGADAGAAAYWPRYLAEWSDWNLVRTAAGAVAAVLFALALALPPAGR